MLKNDEFETPNVRVKPRQVWSFPWRFRWDVVKEHPNHIPHCPIVHHRNWITPPVPNNS